jgi:hypothetical protein
MGTGGTAWVLGAWPRARLRGESVRARLLLPGSELRGRERSLC